MNASPSRCPTDETLRSYGLGMLEDAQSEAVGSHLESCDSCRSRVAAAAPDSFLGKLRQAPAAAGNTVATKADRTVSHSSASMGAPVVPGDLPPGLANNPDYEVLRELGRGGMGVVYLAHNRLMGRDEVLKVMGRHIIERPGVLERFLREIRSVARLRHPNIVTAYSAFRVDDSIAFAMEYVDGLDLSKLVRAKGPLPVGHAAYFIHQAALGLQHAHEEGMVHRDIKPGNLMLARKGDRAVVKVLDFGLARAAGDQGVDGSLTHAGQMLGTPDYIAPEQTLDAQAVDIRADIYSLGCTLYYLLTGKPPFKGTSLYDILQAHHSIDATPLNLVRPDVPVELAALVAKMMAKEPERRFQTPKEVAQALSPFFKKPNEPSSSTIRPATEVSRQATVIPPPTAPLARPEPARPAPQETPVAKPLAEQRWESLIELKETDGPPTPIPAPAESRLAPPDRRPPWASNRVAVGAAGLFLLAALAVVITITIRSSKTGETTEINGTVASKKDATAEASKTATPTPPRQHAFASGGHWNVEGEELVQNNGTAHSFLVFGDPNWTDYDYRVEVMKVTGPGHGIEVVFNIQDPESFVWLGLGVFENKGHEMYFRKNGSGSRAGDTVKDNWKWDGLAPNRWYPVKIKVRKEKFECFLGETRLFRESFAKLDHGRVGLQMNGVKARFRNIKVTSPEGAVLWEGLPDTAFIRPLALVDADGSDLGEWNGDLSSWSWDASLKRLTFNRGFFSGPLKSAKSFGDFELRCRIKLPASSNSGILFRHTATSADLQCDIVGDFTGSLFGGQTLQRSPRKNVSQILRRGDFNDYLIRCVGKHVTIKLNGTTTVDGDFPSIPDHGQVGFEPSWQSPLVVSDLQITDLSGTPEPKNTAAASPDLAQATLKASDGWVIDSGRPTLVAPFRPNSPLLDGVISMGEYGDPVLVDFTAGSRWGGLETRMTDRATSKAVADLSATIRSAYTNDALFLAYEVRDDSVLVDDARQGQPFTNDAVEVFLDADKVANDFAPNPGETSGSGEGFQIIVDAGGHRYTNCLTFTNNDWMATAKRTPGGYIVELAIPLRLIDVEDGPGQSRPGPGSLLHLGSALDDITAGPPEVRAFGYLRSDSTIPSPYFGREQSWTMGIRLAPRSLGPEGLSSNTVSAATPTPGYLPLFNGKDLTGWRTDSRQKGNWRVEDGVLVGTATEQSNGRVLSHLFTTREFGRDLDLHAEARVNGGGEGGVQIRSATGPSWPTSTPRYVLGYKAQIAAPPGNQPPTGGLFIDEEGYVARPSRNPIKAGEWFTIDLSARGKDINVKVNGKTTASYHDAARFPRNGVIALQVLDAWSKVEFRRVEVKEVASKDVASPSKPSRYPADAVVFNGHHYKFFTDQVSWHVARDQCAELGGHLAIVTSERENRFLLELAKSHFSMAIWLGATDVVTEGRWLWVDGSPMRFDLWDKAAKQPNNKPPGEHYLMLLVSRDGLWSDQPDISSQYKPGFVCEWD